MRGTTTWNWGSASVTVYHQPPHVSPDVHQQLVPPRFLEKFTSKKVKKGSSITFSVKVEGEMSCLPVPLRRAPREVPSLPPLRTLLGRLRGDPCLPEPPSWCGETVHHILLPAGDPPPAVHWLREEAEQGVLWIGRHTPGYTVASSAQQHNLVLLDVDRQHQGTYTCIATNAAGQALCSASLHVSGCEWAWVTQPGVGEGQCG